MLPEMNLNKRKTKIEIMMYNIVQQHNKQIKYKITKAYSKT